MWIHLLALGLISGAGQHAAPVIDTHDGFSGSNRRIEEQRKKRKTVRQELERTYEALTTQITAEIEVSPVETVFHKAPHDDDDEDVSILLLGQ